MTKKFSYLILGILSLSAIPSYAGGYGKVYIIGAGIGFNGHLNTISITQEQSPGYFTGPLCSSLSDSQKNQILTIITQAYFSNTKLSFYTAAETNKSECLIGVALDKR